MSRHTFTTMLTLTNGVSIKSVTKMLGPTNIKTIKYDPKIVYKKVSYTMLILRNKFNYNRTNNKKII